MQQSCRKPEAMQAQLVHVVVVVDVEKTKSDQLASPFCRYCMYTGALPIDPGKSHSTRLDLLSRIARPLAHAATGAKFATKIVQVFASLLRAAESPEQLLDT